LTAYTSDGRLKRVVEAQLHAKDAAKKKEPNAEDRDGVVDPKLDEQLPPETIRDLRPFPLNNVFVSQAVLSEELREKIWERIMRAGESVRDVSSALGVEMNRVGAVVRLMEIEKEWKRIVSSLSHFLESDSMMIINKNRLVFKTTTWLQNLACEPL